MNCEDKIWERVNCTLLQECVREKRMSLARSEKKRGRDMYYERSGYASRELDIMRDMGISMCT